MGLDSKLIAVNGPPGCGKTTLFNILTGQMDYDDGEVYVNPNKKIGLISQIPKFPEGYTVEDVLKTAHKRLDEIKARMEELEEAKKAIKTLGLKLEEVKEFPVDGTAHTVIVLKKVAPTPPQYPRRYAKIKQSPL